MKPLKEPLPLPVTHRVANFARDPLPSIGTANNTSPARGSGHHPHHLPPLNDVKGGGNSPPCNTASPPCNTTASPPSNAHQISPSHAGPLLGSNLGSSPPFRGASPTPPVGGAVSFARRQGARSGNSPTNEPPPQLIQGSHGIVPSKKVAAELLDVLDPDADGSKCPEGECSKP